MALSYKYSKGSAQRMLTKPILINGTDTVALGEATECYTNGKATNGAAAKPLKGIIVAITDSHGLPQKKVTPAAGTANTGDTRSITASGDDYVILDTSTDSVYSADVTGTINTTVSSSLLGAKIDIDSSGANYGHVLETTATRTIGTPANFYSYGTDPDDSGNLLVSLAMPEELSVFE